MRAIRTILVPHDFSDYSREAVETAVDLARQVKAESLHLLHVVNPPTYLYASMIDAPSPSPLASMLVRAEERLQAIAAELAGVPLQIETHVVESSGVAATIDAFAKQVGADLVVMGTHGRSGFSHLVHGSVTELAQRHSPCPVLAVRPREAVESDPLPIVHPQPSSALPG